MLDFCLVLVKNVLYFVENEISTIAKFVISM